MKVKLKRIISFMLIAIILVVGVEIYNFLKAPSPIKPYSINSKSSKKKVLITIQKSDFKDLVVKNVWKIRLLLGSDAVNIARTVEQEKLAETKRWEYLSKSTDFDDV